MNRIWLFFFGCMPARILMAYLAYRFPNPIFGLMALIVAIVWLSTTFPTHGVFQGKAWWKNLRPVHATLFLIYATLTVLLPRQAYISLVVDAIFGLIAATTHYTLFV